MRAKLGDFSIREKNLWFELVVDLVVAIYYFPRVLHLIGAGDAALSGKVMTDLIVNTVLLAILVGGVLSALLHTQTKPEPMDERDYMIAARAGVWAGRVLTGCILFIMGHVVLNELVPDFVIAQGGITLTPLIIAHMLLAAIMLAAMAANLAKLYAYRRGS